MSGVRRPESFATLAALAVVLAGPAAAAQDAPRDGTGAVDAAPYSSPYVYQNAGRGRERSMTLQLETGYGSRESRDFTQQGVEQGLRVRFQPWDFLGVEAFGGIVLDSHSGAFRSDAASVEVIGRVLRQDRHVVNLDVGVGTMYDYRHANIPRVRLTLGRTFGRLDLSLSGLLEFPVAAPGRDPFDFMTTIAASWRFLDWLRAGIEFGSEDLEGLWDSTEAEGGAKFLFGPTVAFTGPSGLFLKLNAAPILAVTANQQPVPGVNRPGEWGFMGRVLMGWTYR